MTRKSDTITEETKARLVHSAESEFALHGFKGASLRQICKEAEVTTGALYFLFKDKDDLFRSVISPVTEAVRDLVNQHYMEESMLSQLNASESEDEDFRAAEAIVGIYFKKRRICNIIFQNRDHEAVRDFFDELAALIDDETKKLIYKRYPDFLAASAFNERSIHWFSHLQIDSVTQILEHSVDEAQANEQLKVMIRFMRGGFFSVVEGLEKV